MSQYKPYPAYKDSGVEWLGQVPEHWSVLPLKYIATFRSGGTPSKDNLDFWDGDIPWASAKDLKKEQLEDTQDHLTELAVTSGAASLVAAGSVLVVVRGMILARIFPVVEAMVPMAINQDLKALQASQGLDERFLAYLLRGLANESLRRLEEAGHGTKALRMELWTSMLLTIPPEEEQRTISAYLNRETARIDALVAKKTRFIELLREKRQALITHAITKGLDPSVKMKDSGVEWLGEVSEHWGIKPLKLLVKQGSTISYGIVQPGEPLDEGVPFVQTTNMSSGDFDIEGLQKTTPEIAAAFPRSRLTGGEVILGIRASIGAAFVVPMHLAGVNLSRGVARIDCSTELSSEYLVAYLSSMAVDGYWQLAKQGSTFNEVSIATVKELLVPVPPLHEQIAIESMLNRATARIDSLLSKTERSIELLKERRAALITAAVTGQIDLREAV